MKDMQATYPPDVITQQTTPLLDCLDTDCDMLSQDGTTQVSTGAGLSYNYSDYNTALAAGAVSYDGYDNAPPTGAYMRRVVAVPIGDCSGTTNGQGQVPLLGFGCYFLLQEVGKGSEGSKIFGQFIKSCNTGGVPGAAPGDTPGPYIIQLYKDPGSTDS